MTAEISVFDSTRLRTIDGTIDLNTNTFKIALLSSAFVPFVAAAWVPAQLYIIGDIVTASSGRYYEAVVAGRSAGAEPAFSIVRGGLTNDNTVTWKCWGLSPPSTASLWSEVSGNEVAGTGYVPGGVTLTSPVLTLNRRQVSWTVDTANFGAMTVSAKYAVIYRFGIENGVTNPLVAYVLLDSSGASLNLTLDNPFTLVWDTLGTIKFT